MNRVPEQVYFAGQVHEPPVSDVAATEFARGMMTKFAKAIPGEDNLIIGWFDGSAKGEEGGIGVIVDVCLPAIPKFSILKARPVPSYGQNSVIVELNAGTETCYIIKKMLEKCAAKGMLNDIKSEAPLEIVLVTDCVSLVDFARETTTTQLSGSCALRRAPLLRQLRTLSQLVCRCLKFCSRRRDDADSIETSGIMDINPFIKLHFYQCLRNKVERTKRVDELSKVARVTQKSYRSTVEYNAVEKETSQPQLVERAQDVKNEFQHHSEPPRLTKLIAELEESTRRFPTASMQKKLLQKKTTRRRKAPTIDSGGKRKATVVEEEVEDDDDGDLDERRLVRPATTHRHKRRRVNMEKEIIVLSSDDEDESQNAIEPPVEHIVKQRTVPDESRQHEVIYISSDDEDN